MWRLLYTRFAPAVYHFRRASSIGDIMRTSLASTLELVIEIEGDTDGS